ncbi:MAG: AAA family ATPase [Archangium sp.]|nr:AAA family ATPase [Archangium sp.]
MLRRFYVDNYRCLVNFEFKPEAVNLILGSNGSGKSTFLDALQAVAALATGSSPQSILPAHTLPWWQSHKLQTFELDFDEGDARDHFSYRIVIGHSERAAPTIVEETLKLGDKVLLSFKGGNLALPFLKQPIPFEGKQSALALGLGTDPTVSRFQTHVASILTFKLNPWAMELSARDEDRALWTTGGNLVAYLRSWLQSDPEGFVGWKARVLETMPYLEDIQLRELSPGSRILAGMRHVDGKEVLLGLANFSEGERALMALHAIVGLAHGNRVIGLDEPDNFLAPSEVQPVLRLFTVSPPKRSPAQLMVVTHHPRSIDYLAPYATWIFERQEAGFSRVRRLVFDRESGESASESVLAELSP